MLALATMIA